MSKFRAEEIIILLETESQDYWKLRERIASKAQTQELITALQNAKRADVRVALCYALGRRCDTEAVPFLIKCLYDEDPEVCTEAAEALGNIGDASAGPELLDRFLGLDGCSKNLLAYALGSTGYRPAIPVLIQTLEVPDAVLRGSAAIALGMLGAVEAETALRHAVTHEKESESSRKLMYRALAAVEMVAKAFNTNDKRLILDDLIQALGNPDPAFSQAAAWALKTLRPNEAKPALQNALRQQKALCARTQRIREAILALDADIEQIP